MADFYRMKREINFAAWYTGLTAEQRKAYSRRTRTSVRYIEGHLLHFRKIPRPVKMKALADNAGFDVGDLAAWFYESALTREKSARGKSGV